MKDKTYLPGGQYDILFQKVLSCAPAPHANTV